MCEALIFLAFPGHDATLVLVYLQTYSGNTAQLTYSGTHRSAYLQRQHRSTRS